MRMSKEQVSVLVVSMSVYTKEQIAQHFSAYQTEGLSTKRASWDLFWTLNKNSAEVKSMVRELYASGGNDDHLNTGLNAAIKEFLK